MEVPYKTKNSQTFLEVQWLSLHASTAGEKLKLELLYDPAISLLGIYPEMTLIQKDICTPVFIAALFTIAKTWKQPKCPLTDKEDVVNKYDGILLSQKKWNNAICSNMDGPRDSHTK